MHIFALTGAGLSAESGLGTFRGAPDALWRRCRPQELATPEAFARDPALTRLQAGLQARGDALVLCTQNVDDLHERAGAADVIHIHGQLLEARCIRCRAVSAWRSDMGADAVCPACAAAGWLCPNVVWFGEMPAHMQRVAEELARANLFVAISTSGSVYPAADFVWEARGAGIPTCESTSSRPTTR